VASLVNLLVAQILLRAGRRYDSITLRANSQHLMTDVWTSAGVLVGVGAVALTGWQRLDPIVAALVAANIVRSGVRIVADSVSGLMDTGLPDEEQKAVRSALEGRLQAGARYHALRTRRSGVRRFVSFHVLVPGQWTVQRGHQLVEAIEADLRRTLPNATLFTHLDSLNDPASLDDIGLDRASGPPPPHASDPLPAAPSEIVTIAHESTAATMTRQQLPNFVGISEGNAGAQGISMNLVVIPPGGAAQPHLHRGYETAIYLLKGRVETRYGAGLRKSVTNEAGDFIFIPVDVPHQPVNLSTTEPAHAIVARNDANEQESVEPYDPGDTG
jgi:uncharacterized RmlC-like cupin family protein